MAIGHIVSQRLFSRCSTPIIFLRESPSDLRTAVSNQNLRERVTHLVLIPTALRSYQRCCSVGTPGGTPHAIVGARGYTGTYAW